MQMDELTMMVFKIVISVCAALITAYVVPYINTLKEDSRYSTVLDMVALAVRAAEQTITDPKSGNLKKSKVLKFMTSWLGNRGIILSDEDLSDLIEAAVYQMHKED